MEKEASITGLLWACVHVLKPTHKTCHRPAPAIHRVLQLKDYTTICSSGPSEVSYGPSLFCAITSMCPIC